MNFALHIPEKSLSFAQSLATECLCGFTGNGRESAEVSTNQIAGEALTSVTDHVAVVKYQGLTLKVVRKIAIQKSRVRTPAMPPL